MKRLLLIIEVIIFSFGSVISADNWSTPINISGKNSRSEDPIIVVDFYENVYTVWREQTETMKEPWQPFYTLVRSFKMGDKDKWSLPERCPQDFWKTFSEWPWPQLITDGRATSLIWTDSSRSQETIFAGNLQGEWTLIQIGNIVFSQKNANDSWSDSDLLFKKETGPPPPEGWTLYKSFLVFSSVIGAFDAEGSLYIIGNSDDYSTLPFFGPSVWLIKKKQGIPWQTDRLPELPTKTEELLQGFRPDSNTSQNEQLTLASATPLFLGTDKQGTLHYVCGWYRFRANNRYIDWIWAYLNKPKESAWSQPRIIFADIADVARCTPDIVLDKEMGILNFVWREISKTEEIVDMSDLFYATFVPGEEKITKPQKIFFDSPYISRYAPALDIDQDGTLHLAFGETQFTGDPPGSQHDPWNWKRSIQYAYKARNQQWGTSNTVTEERNPTVWTSVKIGRKSIHLAWVHDEMSNQFNVYYSSKPVMFAGVTANGKLTTTWGRIKEDKLFQNYPNPFNPETWIPYQLAEGAEIDVKIYSATGQLVRSLALGRKPAGFYTDRNKAAYWDGKNEAGEHVSSGVYFYSIKAGDFIATKKLVIAK